MKPKSLVVLCVVMAASMLAVPAVASTGRGESIARRSSAPRRLLHGAMRAARVGAVAVVVGGASIGTSHALDLTSPTTIARVLPYVSDDQSASTTSGPSTPMGPIAKAALAATELGGIAGLGIIGFKFVRGFRDTRRRMR
jgi:hypothetical protein